MWSAENNPGMWFLNGGITLFKYLGENYQRVFPIIGSALLLIAAVTWYIYS